MYTETFESTTTVVRIATESDLILVRQVLRAESERAGLGLVDQTRLITAGSELARNILIYATDSLGELTLEQVRRGDREGVRATFADSGPGIADVRAAMTDGYSTRGSLGLGLPGAKRLVDELTIESEVGTGTTVVIVKWRR